MIILALQDIGLVSIFSFVIIGILIISLISHSTHKKEHEEVKKDKDDVERFL